MGLSFLAGTIVRDSSLSVLDDIQQSRCFLPKPYHSALYLVEEILTPNSLPDPRPHYSEQQQL